MNLLTSLRATTTLHVQVPANVPENEVRGLNPHDDTTGDTLKNGFTIDPASAVFDPANRADDAELSPETREFIAALRALPEPDAFFLYR